MFRTWIIGTDYWHLCRDTGLRPGLAMMENQVRWSMDVDQRVDNGQKVCRSQLLMRIDESGRTQTICITARYGKKSKATVRAMCGEYAIYGDIGGRQMRTSHVQRPTSK